MGSLGPSGLILILLLPFREPELKHWARYGAVTYKLEKFKHPKVEHNNCHNELSSCNIFIAAIVQAQLWRASTLLKYLDKVHRVYELCMVKV